MLVLYSASDRNRDSSKREREIKCEREIIHFGAGCLSPLIHATSNQFRSEIYTTKTGKQVERTYKKKKTQNSEIKAKQKRMKYGHTTDMQTEIKQKKNKPVKYTAKRE